MEERRQKELWKTKLMELYEESSRKYKSMPSVRNEGLPSDERALSWRKDTTVETKANIRDFHHSILSDDDEEEKERQQKPKS